MSYRVNKEDLAPMLARCLAKHGSLEAIQEHIKVVSRSGRDATVSPEFICTNEISRYQDGEEIILKAQALVAESRKSEIVAASDQVCEWPESMLERWCHYLLGGFIISILGGAIGPAVAFGLAGAVLDWDLEDILDEHPVPLAAGCVLIATLFIAWLGWRDEERKHQVEAMRSGKATTARVRKWAVRFNPDGTRTILGRIAGAS